MGTCCKSCCSQAHKQKSGPFNNSSPLTKGFAARVTCGRDGSLSSGGLARERMERKQRAVHYTRVGNWRKPGIQVGEEEPACACVFVLDWIFFFLF